jgi:phage shock protein E
MDLEERKKAVQAVNNGEAQLLDVRRDEEWAEGHAKHALHFDSRRMESGETPELDKDKPIYLYCRGGGRAGRMKTLLEDKGFKNVYNFGGLTHWQEAGGETEQ